MVDGVLVHEGEVKEGIIIGKYQKSKIVGKRKKRQSGLEGGEFSSSLVYDGAVRQEVSGRLVLDPGTFFGSLETCVLYGNAAAESRWRCAAWACIETVKARLPPVFRGGRFFVR